MMIKYRVREVAKDLNVPNKDVLDVLGKYTEGQKKYMTALTEPELDIVFESFTQKHSSENLNEYFAQRDLKKSKEPEKEAKNVQPKANAPQTEEKATPRPVAQKPGKITPVAPRNDHFVNRNNQQNGRPNHEGNNRPPFRNNNNNNSNNNRRRDDKRELSPAQKMAQQRRPMQNRPSVQVQSDQPISHPEARIVDTRSHTVELDKYNEKYDRLASDRFKTDNMVHKQKLTQKRNQYRKPRGARRETEAERMRRIALDRKNKPITVQIPEEITVGELAMRLKATAAEVIKKLIGLGVMAGINDTIDFDTASLAAMEFHAKVEKEVVVTIEEQIIDDSEDKDDQLVPRAPVVVVMGHVDHGKTSLLDAIRHTNVTENEAGGITQHIGAYQVKLGKRDVTFLDTPGHEAFTTMRARGAQVTDIAVLVVAADDGIMPQTIEAIHHAKAAKVSIIVAINKMDKPGANPDRVLKQLTEYELVPEEWGGDTPCIRVSAKQKTGIKDLLEMILLVADMKELKANPDRAAKGTVIEARLDKGRGPIATMLVQNGTLRIGDIIVAGTTVGRVRAMTNFCGRPIEQAGPSVPVEITGLDDVPTGGDIFNAVSDERLARQLVEQRRTAQKEETFNARTKVTLDNLFEQMQEGDMKELQIIVKADVQGSVEAVRQSLEKLSNNE
ncbi:MAG: translation initiation factor IF-2, partial [Oscillospiraceae bacterium]|nr:translation initiation factor IF-2 [Oscillospiraceae bacterium]